MNTYPMAVFSNLATENLYQLVETDQFSLDSRCDQRVAFSFLSCYRKSLSHHTVNNRRWLPSSPHSKSQNRTATKHTHGMHCSMLELSVRSDGKRVLELTWESAYLLMVYYLVYILINSCWYSQYCYYTFFCCCLQKRVCLWRTQSTETKMSGKEILCML